MSDKRVINVHPPPPSPKRCTQVQISIYYSSRPFFLLLQLHFNPSIFKELHLPSSPTPALTHVKLLIYPLSLSLRVHPEPKFVNLSGAQESIPSMAGRYDDPIGSTGPPG